MISQEVIKRCVVHEKKRGRSLCAKTEAEIEKGESVLIRMSNEMEDKPLPRASRCHNVMCIGGRNVGEEEKRVRTKGTSATSSWAAHLIIK
jgi:hypothetical protein